MRRILTLAVGALLVAGAAGSIPTAAFAAPVSSLPRVSDVAPIVKAEWDRDDGGWYHRHGWRREGEWRRYGEWRPHHPEWRYRRWGWRSYPQPYYGYGGYDRGWGGPRYVW